MRNATRKARYLVLVTLASCVPLVHAEKVATPSVTGEALPTVAVQMAIRMPEPSSPSLLFVDLLSVGTLTFLLRRRKPSSSS